jgi:3-hydroxyisobutyrate dehydrogenase-like beta-hydroxyacid dehydrogenase
VAQVTVIGLGAMGGTLACVLAERGHAVTVWNRSGLRPERAAGLDGVAVAGSPAEAIAASPLTLMCVSHYAAAEEILEAPGATESLAGRTLVQLSNGSEPQVRAQTARVRAAGGRMLSGGIMSYPRQIGRPDTVILYSGDASAFEEHRETLADLAGGQRFTGADPAVQNAVYESAFGVYFAALCGFLENAALVADRGVPVSELNAVMPGMAALLLDHLADATRRIETGDWAGDQASTDTHLDGAERRRTVFAERGLQCLMADGYLSYCRQVHEAGDGAQDIAAIFKRIGGTVAPAALPPAGA